MAGRDVPGRERRIGAYGVCRDAAGRLLMVRASARTGVPGWWQIPGGGVPAGRILLTRIAPGYPGAGRWHLPGGGTDYGEQPAVGLLREIVERPVRPVRSVTCSTYGTGTTRRPSGRKVTPSTGTWSRCSTG
ncbi:NUDIX domain-containing protein [Solwaraspora sp. WMMD406]|uniref:NUDIX hydrolase n=1 Tax=Solwaraspora sp. WMMD406 TaxID=3016095 RepID=UPI002416EAB5|nr:NUDIX domain-containing protein [Solwaraspora sp. WMMD406]MDG4763778.1 NUDIX domain-containing protein [Solwaraspora sp. WMMD406]